MSAITNTAITKLGMKALAYTRSNEQAINFTHMQIGDGYHSGELEDQTSLMGMKLNLPVTNIERHGEDESEVWVEATMSNEQLEAGFYYREIGLFCTNPENESEEVLYCYGSAGDQAEFVVADNSSTAVLKTIRLILSVSNKQEVTITINDENHATNNYVNEQVSIERAARLAEKTNCLIEAPQHLNFTLEKGTLALVGDVSVDNSGVMSNFATSRHANIPQSQRYVDGTYIFKFTTGADITTQQYIVHGQVLFTLGINAGVLESYSFSQNQRFPVADIAANTTYWVKVVLNGTSKEISLSTDGSTYGDVVTIEDLTMSASALYPIRLGCSSYDTSLPFLGKIDSACQIFRNNVLIYTGKVGGITLKSGSQVYRTTPAGIVSETLQADYTLKLVDSLKSGKRLLIWTGATLWSAPADFCFSKPKNERPTSVANGYALFYATDEKLMYLSGNQGVDWFSENYTLPLAELTVIDGIITDYVPFNGSGYIDSYTFVLENNKGLAANGRNSNGTSKNKEITTTGAVVQAAGAGSHDYYLLAGAWIRNARVSTFYEQETQPLLSAQIGAYAVWHNPATNLTYYTNDSGATWIQASFFKLAKYSTLNNKIISWQPLPPFRAADHNEIKTDISVLQTLIDEKDFEIDSLGRMIELDLTKMFIQIFEDTTQIDTTKGDGLFCISNYYDKKKHIFVKNDNTTKTIYSVVKQVTTGNNNVYSNADWTNISNGAVKFEASRDGGTTWTTLTQGTLTNISSQPAGTSMVLRVTVSGVLKLKNLAWGMKS